MIQNFTLLVARLGLSLVFILSGIDKIIAYAATTKELVAEGLAPGLLPIVIAVELGGGLLILCGLFTRSAAVVLFAWSIATALWFHAHLGDRAQWLLFMQSLAIAGGFLVLAVHGPGKLSIDSWRQWRRQRQKIFF